jgi:hypothetical protein
VYDLNYKGDARAERLLKIGRTWHDPAQRSSATRDFADRNKESPALAGKAGNNANAKSDNLSIDINNI